MIEILKIIGTILVAVITTFGAGYFALKKMYIERQDKRDEELLQKRIDDSLKKVREEVSAEIKKEVRNGIVECGVIGDRAIREVQDEFIKKLDDGLKARGDEGKERFEINSQAIEKNTKQISELTDLVKDQIGKMTSLADSITKLSEVATISAMSQRNANYDRILIVANGVLKAGKITINQKTNLRQLYKSWKALKGEDEKIDTLYEECINLPIIPDEG